MKTNSEYREQQKARQRSVRHISDMLKPCTRMTLKEVGICLGIPMQRVSQIEKEVFWKIQKRMNERLKEIIQH